jgi:hypothetical protein
MQIGRTASNNSVAPAEAMFCHTVLTTGRSAPLDQFHTRNLEIPIDGTGSSSHIAEISSSPLYQCSRYVTYCRFNIICVISEYTLYQSISLSAPLFWTKIHRLGLSNHEVNSFPFPLFQLTWYQPKWQSQINYRCTSSLCTPLLGKFISQIEQEMMWL